MECGIPGWLHGEMLRGESGPSFPLLSCVIRKPTAKKIGFEMPTPGFCGSRLSAWLSLWTVHVTNTTEVTASWREQACQAGTACPYLACDKKCVGVAVPNDAFLWCHRYCLAAKEGPGCCKDLLFICLDKEELDSPLMMWLSVGSLPPVLFLDDSYSLCNSLWNCNGVLYMRGLAGV